MAPDATLLSEVEGIDLKAVLTTINQRIEYLIGREYRIGHAFFINCESRAQVEDAVRNKVIRCYKSISSRTGAESRQCWAMVLCRKLRFYRHPE